MAIAMISLHSWILPLSAHPSYLRTGHLPARACSTGRRGRARSAVHPAHRATRLLVFPRSSSNGSKIGGSDGKLPLGGGGCGGRSGKPGSGGEDDRSGEDFRVLNIIVKLLRRVLQLGVESLAASDLLATMHSWVSISAEEMQCPSSSHSSNSTHENNLIGDDESHCDGISSDKLKAIMPAPWDNHSDKSSGTISKQNKYRTRTAQGGTRTTNSQDHHVDIDISDDETPLDENEKKMKGRRSYAFTMASSSLAWAGGLFPYIAHSSRFKDGRLPDNARFKLFEILQLVVFICLCTATFIPQHVCRGVSNWVVWPSAAGAIFIIVIHWAIVFQQKTVIKRIKDKYDPGVPKEPV